MHDSPYTIETDSAVAESASPQVESTPPFSSDDLTKESWPHIWLGISLSGGIYPIIAVGIVIAVGALVTVWQSFDGTPDVRQLSPLIGGGIAFATIALFASVIGIFYSGVATIVTTPLVYLFVRSLKLRCDVVLIGAAWGGLVGFVCVMPIAFGIAEDIAASSNVLLYFDRLVPLVLGPGLTTILGQLGGAWGGARARGRGRGRSEANYERALAQAAANRWRLMAGGGEERGFEVAERALLSTSNPPQRVEERPRFQFSIRHLLWITVWLSVLLSVIRLAGISMEFVVPMLMGWLVYQSATLYVVWRIARRWKSRQRLSQGALAGRIL